MMRSLQLVNNDYEGQAQEFLDRTGATFKAKFLRFGKHFEDDKDCRDIYRITLERGEREYSFDFGQSVAMSGRGRGTPSPYDVLACLTKYHPGTLEDFSADFGYDLDSRKAEKVYKAVCEEVQSLERLFNADEMKLMQEIQ